jgi:hypothetical protein
MMDATHDIVFLEEEGDLCRGLVLRKEQRWRNPQARAVAFLLCVRPERPEFVLAVLQAARQGAKTEEGGKPGILDKWQTNSTPYALLCWGLPRTNRPLAPVCQ